MLRAASGQSASVRVPEPYLSSLRLYGCDRNNAYDILGAASSRKIVHRSCDTLEDRSVRFGFGEPLSQFICNVAAVKIGEYEYVRFSRHGAARSL